MTSPDIVIGVASILISASGVIITLFILSFRLGSKITKFNQDLNNRLDSIADNIERNNNEIRKISENMIRVETNTQKAEKKKSVEDYILNIEIPDEKSGKESSTSKEDVENVGGPAERVEIGRPAILRIPSEQLKKVDRMVESGEYPNREEAVQAVVRELFDLDDSDDDQDNWNKA
jgi:hypothetical protein